MKTFAGPDRIRWPCEEIKWRVAQMREQGAQPNAITLGRELVHNFVDNLLIDYRFHGITHIKIVNALQKGRAQQWLEEVKFVSYRGIPLRIVEGDQLTVE